MTSLGGCDAGQPVYTETACDALGHEFGADLNRRIVAIIRGPESVNWNGRSVLSTHAIIVTTQRLNFYVRRQGIVRDCGAEGILLAAEEEFSDELKENSGPLVGESPDNAYPDWLDIVRRQLQVIDQEEDWMPPSPDQ